MEKFIWTEDYSVGIKLIDDQHQRFFEIANEILGLIDEKEPEREVLSAYLDELGNYALYHLGTEERFFDEFKYQGAPEHRVAHDIFRTTVGKYLDDVRKTTTNITELSGNTASFSSSWLKNHIFVMDKQYAMFFHEHGLR